MTIQGPLSARLNTSRQHERRIAVVGLWHLGLVTAAVMAEAGHDVTAFDRNDIVAALERGDFPVAEPHLAELWKLQREAGRLRTTSRLADIADHRFIWVCYDTPLDAGDRPDTAFVRSRLEELIDALAGPAMVAISSQTPVGFVSELEATYTTCPRPHLRIDPGKSAGRRDRYLRARAFRGEPGASPTAADRRSAGAARCADRVDGC